MHYVWAKIPYAALIVVVCLSSRVETPSSRQLHSLFYFLLFIKNIKQRICFNALVFTVSRPNGYLFDKESLLEYVISKKKENARKMKEFERQKRLQESEAEHKVMAEHADLVSRFVKQETDITVASTPLRDSSKF